MRYGTIVCCLLLLGTAAVAKQHGYIPDQETALRVARAELTHVYGKMQIQAEEPLTAGLKDGIWTVWGTLWCHDDKG